MVNQLELTIISGRGPINQGVRKHILDCMQKNNDGSNVFPDPMKLVAFYCCEHVKYTCRLLKPGREKFT